MLPPTGRGGMSDPPFPGNIVAHEWYVRLDMNFSVVAYTVLLYDYLCTFSMEVQYLWPSRWSLVLPFFYVNRYLPMANLVIVLYLKNSTMPFRSCQIMGPVILWLSTVMMLTSQAIIAIRTYALWGGNRFLLYILIAWGLIFPGAAVVLSGIATHMVLGVALPEGLNPKLVLKCPTDAPYGRTVILIFHTVTLVGEIIIVTLTGIKARQHMNRVSPWLKRLYHTGILQCCTMLSFSVVNTVVVMRGPPELQLSILPLQCNIHSILCSRIILLIRKNGRVTRPDRMREARESRTTDVGSMYTLTSVHTNGECGMESFTTERQAQPSCDTRPELEW